MWNDRRLAALLICILLVATVVGCAQEKGPGRAELGISSGEPARPRAEDVRLEVVERLRTEDGIAVKLAVENVGPVGAHVAARPYVILGDGTKAGRSPAEGPVFLDAGAGKRSFVLASIKLTPQQVADVTASGIEDVSVELLEGTPLTPQLPGFTRRSAVSSGKGKKAEAVDAFAIVPGKGLGPVHLGMTADEAMAAGSRVWNEDAEVNDTLGVVMSWPKTNVLAHAAGKPDEPPRVFSVRTTNPRFRVKGRVAVGGAYRTTRKLLGRPSYYDKMAGLGARAAWPSGVWLDHDPAGRIVCIGVDFDHGLILFR